MAIKAEIEKTDQEIVMMVYELYGLTEEEIGIVKRSCKLKVKSVKPARRFSGG